MPQQITTIGREFLNSKLPEQWRGRFDTLDGKGIDTFLNEVAHEDPDAYPQVVKALVDVGGEATTYYGDEASYSIKDFDRVPAIEEYRNRLRDKMGSVIKQGGKPEDLIPYLSDAIKEGRELVGSTMKNRGGGLAAQVSSRARGNIGSATQILFGDIMLDDAMGRPVPIPALEGYIEGVTPLTYWASTHGARKGQVDVQAATARAGYLGKQLTNVAHRVVVTEDDCGTRSGIPVDPKDSDIEGSVLAMEMGDLPAGTVIERGTLKGVKKPIYIRSSVTCQAKNGICSRCAGKRESGYFPDIGEPVGMVASRAVSEPVTQAGLSVKHTGGISEGVRRKIQGFDELNQFFQVPPEYIGATPVVERDGAVTSIKRGKVGGHIVSVEGEDYYVPDDQKVIVSVGDKLEAGDALGDAVPSPEDIVRLKGIGEGRRYFVEKFLDALAVNKARVNRRNVEAVARGFVNRVKITDPDGIGGSMMGDIVPYDDIVRDYEPREGAKRVKLSEAAGGYLEEPVLHYAIGDRINKRALEALREYGIKEVLVHNKPPKFEPVLVRAPNILASDPDWMTRLSGEGLKRSLLDAARRGGTSTPYSTSYVPAVSDPSKLRPAGSPIADIFSQLKRRVSQDAR